MITITSDDERAELRLDSSAERGANRLILADSEGWEYHFGSGPFTPLGTFNHVATYSAEGREPYAFWWQVVDGIECGCEIRDEPELGPNVSPLAVAAVESLFSRCNSNHVLSGDPEKDVGC